MTQFIHIGDVDVSDVAGDSKKSKQSFFKLMTKINFKFDYLREKK